jgi:transketolase
MDAAIAAAWAETERPSIIMAKTTIGFGCPTKAGTADTHGAPVGPDEIAGARQCFRWEMPEFAVPTEVYSFCHDAVKPKLDAYEQWQKMMQNFAQEEPERTQIFRALQEGDLPSGLAEKVLASLDGKAVATRRASGAILQVLAKELPLLFGGSADLAPSNNTMVKGAGAISKGDFSGRNLHFGIREHGMAAMLNGMALYGLIPYGGTFLVFADYMRPSIRLAALMGLRVIYVFTHDSIFVGEDGPTHQPVEQVASLRLIPNLHVIRPADAAETALAWTMALERRSGPTALILTRQTVPAIDRAKYAGAQGLKKGAYVLAGSESSPDLIILASGSEVGIALEVFEELKSKGVKARLVNMACFKKFDEQDDAYKEEVLPRSCEMRVAIEAGVSFGWHKYAGSAGLVISMDRFGASAPYKVLAEKFGFNKQAVLEMIRCTYPELGK